MSRAFTTEEIRDKFIRQVEAVTGYWIKQGTDSGQSHREVAEGVAYSILAILDGSHMALPGFIVAPSPHESDEVFHIENGDNFYPYNDPEAVKSDIAGYLHEIVFQDKSKEEEE